MARLEVFPQFRSTIPIGVRNYVPRHVRKSTLTKMHTSYRDYRSRYSEAASAS